MSRGTRLALLGAAVVVLVVAIVITTSGGDDNKNESTTQPGQSAGTTGETTTPTKPKPKVTQIRVVGGKPAGGIVRIAVKKGDRVRFTVTSDVADEVHVHGYDYMKDVAAGGSVKFNFKANISGSFEIELEGRTEQIAKLKVEP